MKQKERLGTGRRNTAVASVRIRTGTGNVDVNGRKFEDYFPEAVQRQTIVAPIENFSSIKKYDILIRVKGGGIHGQAIASRLGIARALLTEDEGLRKDFKDLGYLTRDPRKRERKKYGLKGARKRFQFSKR